MSSPRQWPRVRSCRTATLPVTLKVRVVTEIVLHLEDESAPIDVRSLRDALKHLAKILDHVGEGDPAPLPVTDLHSGSAHATLEAPAEVADIFNEGVRSVQATKTLPSEWSMAALRGLRSLCAVGPATMSVSLEVGASRWLADAHLALAVDDALSRVPESLGSVTGRLCAYSSARRPVTARIEMPGRSETLQILIEDEDALEAAQHLESEVRIWGLIRRHPQTNALLSMSMERLEPLGKRPRPLPVPPERIVGIWNREATGGMSSEDWIRELRNG